MKSAKGHIILAIIVSAVFACRQGTSVEGKKSVQSDTISAIFPDTLNMPKSKLGEAVRYGRDLFLFTAYYIGPEGVNGKYTGNKINCTHCHQWAGTKPFSFNLMKSHNRYPMYRAREGKVLSLAERINNCVTRPHNGIPLPLDSKEMIAMLSYLKWINETVPKDKWMTGEEALPVEFPAKASNPEKGSRLYVERCSRCHGANGEGRMNADSVSFLYPPLWGDQAYQPGSSMHRVIKQAQWIKANMPFDSAKWDKPVLTDEEAFDIAAFVNDDRIHSRPNPATLDFPFPEDKAIDYGKGPYIDTFSEAQHKFGPYEPIMQYWKNKGLKPRF